MGVLTGVLAGAYFLGFLGVAGACRKSPMKSSRKVYIIRNYQTQITLVGPAGKPGRADVFDRAMVPGRPKWFAPLEWQIR